MTHEKLLGRIDDQDFAYDYLASALRAVVELHVSETKTLSDGDVVLCHSCGATATDTSMKDRVYYPCKTIQVIERELQ